MPGTVPGEFVLQGSFPGADLSIVRNMQSYILYFDQGDSKKEWGFEQSRCEILGLASGAVNLCIENSTPSEIRACKYKLLQSSSQRMTNDFLDLAMLTCPSTLAIGGRCLSDRSWLTSTTNTVTTSLRTTFRWADVAYHRPNNSIAWHTLLDGEEDAPLSAVDVLYTFKTLALGSSSLVDLILDTRQGNTPSSNTAQGVPETEPDLISELLNLTNSLLDTPAISKRQVNSAELPGLDGLLSSLPFGLGGLVSSRIPGGNPIFPALPYSSLQAIAIVSENNPALAAMGTNFLQNFLAIPLFWCQKPLAVRSSLIGPTGLYTEALFGNVTSETDETTKEVVGLLKEILGPDEEELQRLREAAGNTTLVFARLEYRLHVGMISFAVYAVLTALLLTVCVVALAIGSTQMWAGNVPAIGSFALFDITTHLTVIQEGGVYHEDDQHSDTTCVANTNEEQVQIMRRARVGLTWRSVSTQLLET